MLLTNLDFNCGKPGATKIFFCRSGLSGTRQRSWIEVVLVVVHNTEYGPCLFFYHWVDEFIVEAVSRYASYLGR